MTKICPICTERPASKNRKYCSKCEYDRRKGKEIKTKTFLCNCCRSNSGSNLDLLDGVVIGAFCDDCWDVAQYVLPTDNRAMLLRLSNYIEMKRCFPALLSVVSMIEPTPLLDFIENGKVEMAPGKLASMQYIPNNLPTAERFRPD